MALPLIGILAGPIIEAVSSLISEVVTDKDERDKLTSKVALKIHDLEKTELQGRIDIILAEAKGSWMQKNWRPSLMFAVIAILINNLIITPYLTLFGYPATILELPPELYTMMTVGVGGYITGRTGEKMIKTWKGKEDD